MLYILGSLILVTPTFLIATGGERPDMDIRPWEPVPGVRTLRFTSLRVQGHENLYLEIAIGEIRVESPTGPLHAATNLICFSQPLLI